MTVDPLQLGSMQSPPLIDEFQLMMGDDIYDLWLRTRGVAPHWFFAWAGGIALARWTLDHRGDVFENHTVIDIGCGTGLNTVAALRAGADHVFAIDRNRYARELTIWNLEINRSPKTKYTVTDTVPQFNTVPNSTVLLGDVFYESAQLLDVIDDALEHNCTVLVGDPGREYTPYRRLVPLETYTVPNQQLLEKRDYIGATVYRATSNTVEE